MLWRQSQLAKVARRMLVTEDSQRSVPLNLQFDDEGIDQRLERSCAHQLPGIPETLLCHHHPPIEAPRGSGKDCSYADRPAPFGQAKPFIEKGKIDQSPRGLRIILRSA
jgi:hypothetical protein